MYLHIYIAMPPHLASRIMPLKQSLYAAACRVGLNSAVGMARGDEEKQNNIVMFPFMAQGHIIPFMSLATLITKRKPGHSVTFVSTPLNVVKLRSSHPGAADIRFRELPFDSAVYGLPPGTEDCASLSLQSICLYLEASEKLESGFKELVEDMTARDGHAPVCIISDMFLGWTARVAEELGIFHSVFIAGSAYAMAAYFSFSMNMPHLSSYKVVSKAEEGLLLHDFHEASDIPQSAIGVDLKFNAGFESFYAFRARQFTLCLRSQTILLNTTQGVEMGQSGVEYFKRKSGGKPVRLIGPVVSSTNTTRPDNSCIQFLDGHPPASVIYVSFGSQNSILPAQMTELAKGLEASGKAFIWVIRPPIGFSVTEAFRGEWLPEGFENRVRQNKQGLVVKTWAPQQDILSHKSTGAFLSHCGWNSVLESLTQGVPIIGWPLVGDQLFNSHMLQKDVGVCVEVARGYETDSVSHELIAELIRRVMGSTETGVKLKSRAMEVREQMEMALRDTDSYRGSSVKALGEFLCDAAGSVENGVSLMV